MEQLLGIGLVPLITIVMLLALVVMALWVIKNYIKIPPNKAAIIYGLFAKPKGSTRGYNIVTGGATLVIPLIQRVNWLDLDLMTIPLEVKGAYSEQGVPVTVKGVANIRFSSDEGMLATAAEQFGSKTPDEIRLTARETLVGGLRAVVGKQTVEDLYKNREGFSQSVQQQIAGDFQKMGLTVQSLPIQEVSDDEGYLISLGKKRTAEVKRDASIGEAQADRERREKIAEATRIATEAEIASDQSIAEKRRDLDIKKAQIRQEVDAKNAEAEQAGPMAKAKAELGVRVAEVAAKEAETTARIKLADQETLRVESELQFTVIKPAEAERKAASVRAEGVKNAAIILANQQKETSIIAANASKEAAVLSAEATRTTATAQAEAARQKGIGEADALKALKLADAAGIEANKKADAAGDEAMLLAKARGDKEQRLAEAAGTEASLMAEARGMEAKLMAEAKGKLELAKALAALDPTGRLLQVLEAAPKLAEAVGSALAKALGPEGAANMFGQASQHLASVDSIKILDMNGGGANGQGGLSNFANVGPRFVFDMLSSLKALGINVPDILEKLGIKSNLVEEFIGDMAKNGSQELAIPAESPKV